MLSDTFLASTEDFVPRQKMSIYLALLDLDRKLREKDKIQRLRVDIVQLRKKMETLSAREQWLKAGILSGK